MTIREKRTPISQFAAALRQRSPQEKRDLLVADTLDSLCRHCDLYDAARVSSNPFHPELLRTIAAADLSSESVFGNFSFYSYKKACGQKKTVRGSKNSRRLSNGTPAI
ncbi:hypothetical protein AB9L11_11005 [Desulfovibrio piger]